MIGVALSLIPALLQAAPSIAGWFGGDDAEKVATEVVGIAKRVTGIEDDKAAVDKIAADPQLAKLFETQAHEYRLERLKAETLIVKEVNATMRAEAKAEDPWARRWRPFWGFVSAVAFGMVALAISGVLVMMAWQDTASFIAQLPAVVSSMAALFGIPAAILGVASWHRGKMQRIQAGENMAKQGGTGWLDALTQKGKKGDHE